MAAKEQEPSRTSRNKTLTLSPEETAFYAGKSLRLADPAPIEKLQDRIICGDTFATLPLLPEKFADLIIADPPYNLRKDYHGATFRETSQQEYADYTRRWIAGVRPLLKDNASLYVCCDWKSSIIIGPILAEYFLVQNRITWQREKGRGAKANWKNGMEDIWFCTCGKDYYFDLEAVKVRRRVRAPYRTEGAPKDWEETAECNFRNTCTSTFWDDISVPYWSMPENTDHPTQKPEKLMAKLILASCPPGGMVFDPFLGSGTTAVTAKKLGRRFCGVEQNPLYCAWGEERLERAEEDKTIQGFADGVFWERNAAPPRKRGQQKKKTE